MRFIFYFTIICCLNTLMMLGQNSKPSVDICQSGVRDISDYKFQKAIKKLDSETCLKGDKSNYYLKKLAYAYKKTANYKQAKINYNKLLTIDSTNTNALFHLADIYRREANDQKAQTYYERLVSTDSLNSYYHKILGDFYWSQKNIKGTAIAYQKAYQLNEDNIEVIYKLSKIYFKIKLYLRVEQLLEQGLKINPENIQLLKQKAKLAYTQKSNQDVIEIVNTVDTIVDQPSNYLLKLKAIALYHTDQFQLAIDLLAQLLNKYKETEILHYYMAMAYKKIDDLDKSRFHFEKAIDEGMSDNLASYFTNLGLVFEKQGNLKEAIQAYKLAYEESNKNILLYRLAKNYDIYYADKEIALKYYQRYLEKADTSKNQSYTNHAKKRVSSIKREIHFDIDTLN